MFKHFLVNMLQLLLSPGNGWEDIGRNCHQPDREFREGFIPLVLLSAFSSLLNLVYHHGLSVPRVILEMVVIFLMYFIGYFIGTFVLSIFLGPCVAGKPDYHRAQLFVIYSLGLLALITLCVNVLPMTAVLLFFMPVYVGIIMWKGCNFLNIAPRKTASFVLTALLGVLLPPYVIYFICQFIMP